MFSGHRVREAAGQSAHRKNQRTFRPLLLKTPEKGRDVRLKAGKRIGRDRGGENVVLEPRMRTQKVRLQAGTTGGKQEKAQRLRAK